MFNKNDVIVCRDNVAGSLGITINKEYIVLDSWSTGVKIINDDGKAESYLFHRFTLKKPVPAAKQIKLEVGKTYLTAGGYVVHITAMKPVSGNQYYTTIECSPGFNCDGKTIQDVLSSCRKGEYKKYGWQYQSDGTIFLGNEWTEKLRITEEFSKLKPAPKGFRYAGGFPQARPPKKGEFYMCCMSGDAIQANQNESSVVVRVIIEKEESKMPPYPTMPEGFKFASDPPEHRKPKKGEWFIGGGNKPDFAAVDFLNNSYYIISKIEETYPKGRIDKPVAKTPAPAPKEEVYPKYYSPLNVKDWAFIKRTDEFAHVLTKYDGTEVLSGTGWCKHHDALYVEIPAEVALAQIKKPIAQTPSPPKIDLYVEVEVKNAATAPEKPQPRLSYWITEPIGNMFGAAKKSARYVVASSLLAAVGYTAFNPVQTFNFVGSCLPKIHVKFGSEPLKFVPINDIPAVPAEWGNKNVGSP